MSPDFFLAWKYFKPKRNAVSIIPLISVIGVGLGVAVLMVVLAVMTGFSDKMKEKLIDTTSHAQIIGAYGRYIPSPKHPVQTVENLGGTALPISRVVTSSASTVSEMETWAKMRVSGFNVVSQSWSASISPRPL